VVDAQATSTGGGTVRRCIVPSVTGLTLAKARARLVKARCRVGTVRRLKGARKPLVVRRQSRQAGTRLKVNTKITLTLGSKRRR
jgi:beta-lactam-binding protein with PASTA domain